MAKQFLIFILTTAILSMGPIFAMEQEIPEENRDILITPQSFDFVNGNQETLNKWVAENGAEIYHHLNNHPNLGYPENSKKPLFIPVPKIGWFLSFMETLRFISERKKIYPLPQQLSPF